MFAPKRIANPKDRERFVELVRESIAGSIKKGEPLPDVKLRDGVATSDASQCGEGRGPIEDNPRSETKRGRATTLRRICRCGER